MLFEAEHRSPCKGEFSSILPVGSPFQSLLPSFHCPSCPHFSLHFSSVIVLHSYFSRPCFCLSLVFASSFACVCVIWQFVDWQCVERVYAFSDVWVIPFAIWSIVKGIATFSHPNVMSHYLPSAFPLKPYPSASSQQLERHRVFSQTKLRVHNDSVVRSAMHEAGHLLWRSSPAASLIRLPRAAHVIINGA